MDAALGEHAAALFGSGSSAAPDAAPDADGDEDTPTVGLDLTRRQVRQLWDRVHDVDDFWETLREIEPGAISRLAGIAAARRWEVIFLTSRPASAGRTVQVQTQRWLSANGFPLPSVYVVRRSRGR